MSEFTGLDEFREWLEELGYIICKNSFQRGLNECDWYAAKRTKLASRYCETNDHKIQIIVTPYFYEISGRIAESCEVDVTGEESATWFKLQAYSVKPEEFKAQNEIIEAKLIDAWNALSKASHD
jgi:hypothetical protein